MKRSLFSICLALLLIIATVAASNATVTPTIFVNGSQYNQTWRPEYAAPSLSIGMQTDEAVLADWWLVCLTPSGWKYYHPTYGYWYDGMYPVCQGNLLSFDQIVIPTSGLDMTKPGTFTVYFGIDKTVDGIVTADSLVATGLSVNIIPTGKHLVITIFDTFQVVGFDLSAGVVDGFLPEGKVASIPFSQIKNVKGDSDRLGWNGTVASVPFDKSGASWIPNTINSDRELWSLELTSGGIAWINLDDAEVVYSGKNIVRTADNMIEYNNYRPQSMAFTGGSVKIDYACNATDGFVSHVNPSDISYIKWNSDSTDDWSKTVIWGLLQIDASGSYYVSMTGVTGSGLFSAVLKNGTIVWFNIDSWTYSGASLGVNAAGERRIIIK